jgi:mannosyl-3-phosphoglycerate phosphatase family protein
MYVIFTDLDGTLIDDQYSFQEVLPCIRLLKEKQTPVVFCSAKTKPEQEALRNSMGVEDPFVVEDGSAICIPPRYFGETKGELIGGYETIILGARYEEIKRHILSLRQKYRVKSYCTMTDEEVTQTAGLTLEQARKAKDRGFSETIIEADEEAIQKLRENFTVVQGGRFMQVFGRGTSKGKAVERLSGIYRNRGQVTAVGIGNSYNDEAMLRTVDLPALVRNPDGSHADLDIPDLYRADEVGPKGWTEVVEKFVLER